jgi:hypothetical protein
MNILSSYIKDVKQKIKFFQGVVSGRPLSMPFPESLAKPPVTRKREQFLHDIDKSSYAYDSKNFERC